MNKHLSVTLCLLLFVSVGRAQTLTLDSCRRLAVNNSKTIKVTQEKINAARYERKAARSLYFPALDFNAMYFHNQHNVSLFGHSDLLPAISSLLTFDVRNVYAGALTLTQPVFTGGKIMTLNRMADRAGKIAGYEYENAVQNIVFQVDEAYWTVVSLQSKCALADSYVSLLDTLSFNVNEMYLQGVATKSDCLSVEVKSSEARLAQLKANNGLSLAKMALAQLCGLEITDDFEIADNLSLEDESNVMPNSVDILHVYDKRRDIRMLVEAVDLSRQNERLALSEMLPKLVVVGAYTFTNPNLIDGFENRFGGGFSVGATLSIPLWHWGGNYNKLRSAKAQTAVSRLVLEDAEEMVELQVRQAEQRLKEAESAVMIADKNLSLAEENMRNANLGFEEGVVAVDVVLAAHAAWRQAKAEALDAHIALRLGSLHLQKVMGEELDDR